MLPLFGPHHWTPEAALSVTFGPHHQSPEHVRAAMAGKTLGLGLAWILQTKKRRR
jgi:hypothetical protein